MERIDYILTNRPEIGVIGSIGGSLQMFVETASPLLQFFGLCLGVAIGVYTLLIKRREYQDKTHNTNEAGSKPDI